MCEEGMWERRGLYNSSTVNRCCVPGPPRNTKQEGVEHVFGVHTQQYCNVGPILRSEAATLKAVGAWCR